MQLKDCPADILLHLLAYLELVDALHLLSTCTRLRKLSENRSLWIQLLRRTESDGSQPLACPPKTDLLQLSLSDLQGIARHTARLEKNWSSENPHIIGVGTTVQFDSIEGPFSILAVVPGTYILVLNHAETLFCYDLETKTCCPWWTVGWIKGHAQFAEHRKHFIAVVHGLHLPVLDVFCVNYGPGTQLTLQKVYHNNLNALPGPIFFEAVFMQDAIVGILYDNASENYLVAYDIYTNASITIYLPLISPSPTYPYCSCLVQGNSVYIALQQLETCVCRLFRCDISAPWDNGDTDGRFNPSPFATFDTVTVPETYIIYPPECEVLHPVGLCAINATIPDTDLIPATVRILFHPDIFTSFHPADTLQLVLDGEPREKNPNVFSTHTGNFLLVCISSAPTEESLRGANPQLHMIRFVKGPPASIQVRQLPIPSFIRSQLELDRICSIALDDHLGVLYLTNKQGSLYAVPFAGGLDGGGF